MLGRVYRDRGDFARAVEWFERAAGAPAPSAPEGRALLADLDAARTAARTADEGD